MKIGLHFFTPSKSVPMQVRTASIAMALAISFLMVISTGSFAARKFSAASGDWTTGTTWVGGVVPANDDTVFVLKQHTVIVNSNVNLGSAYIFLVVVGTLDLTDNGKLTFKANSKVIVETGGRILGNGNQDTIKIGSGNSEYNGSMGDVTGPAYISDEHSPSTGEGTSGCNCYNGIGVSSCTITSSTGYTVHILVWAKKINPNSNPCSAGFQYNVKIDYSVQFTGSNIPGALWDLRGTLFCGPDQMTFNLPPNGGNGTMDTQNSFRSSAVCNPTPASMGCLNASILVYGPGIASQTCSTPLPIELLSFAGSQCNNAVCLNWATASEQNFDKFIVEHSADGLNYDSIGFVPATGNSKLRQEYQFQHLLASIGKNYYRLKSLDLDLSYDYSPVILTNFDGEKNIVVFPNPVIESSVQIFTNFTPAVGDKVEIFDNLGLKLMEYEISTPDSKLTFNWTLKHGSYLLRYVSGGYSKIIRFTSN